ncbi:CG12971 [Drosophila busckii]|uniref:CG12971 n=1 Tax=Drosophila busckii TaxID=30019 RepID=A0A0M4EEI9_DROBS|nr:putative uncharacterized protein DDB_G0294196 [Drosophila busckii]ALC44208.1 CG12971 [Drosophila busckii]
MLNKSRSFVLLCACLSLAAADVSHLSSSSYLPPARPEQVESMTIEQHELRELPEQVEYMRPSELGAMEQQPSSQLTPPVMSEASQMLAQRYLPPAMTQALPNRYLPPTQTPPMMEAPMMMPAARYLPPAQPAMPEMPATRYLPPPAETTPELMMQPEMPEPEHAMDMMPTMMPEMQPQAAPANRYLPPAQQPEQPQFNYQQYQEQLQQEQQQQQQQQQQEQQMPYILDVQQPLAPTDMEMPAFEPQPAHELRNDGYHYKEAPEELRLRH